MAVGKFWVGVSWASDPAAVSAGAILFTPHDFRVKLMGLGFHPTNVQWRHEINHFE